MKIKKYQYNCFTCDGKQKDRVCYKPTLNKEYCHWRIVADNDLIKHGRGQETILTKMLDDFLVEEDTRIMTKEELEEFK